MMSTCYWSFSSPDQMYVLREGTEDYRLINENVSVFIKENDAFRQQSSGLSLSIQDLSKIIVK